MVINWLLTLLYKINLITVCKYYIDRKKFRSEDDDNDEDGVDDHDDDDEDNFLRLRAPITGIMISEVHFKSLHSNFVMMQHLV